VRLFDKSSNAPIPSAVTLEPHDARQKVREYLKSAIENKDDFKLHEIKSSDPLYKDQVYPFVIALVPGHNEEKRIHATLHSLITQSRPPDEIIVIADNCTDATKTIALSMGANVVQTHGNTDMKAGALNQVLDTLLPLLDETDSILVMDADTVLSPNFIRAAMHTLFAPLKKGQKPVAGVGGIFLGLHEKWSLASQLQVNEYVRYQRRLSRRRGRALVLTGTGTMFNIRTLREVVLARKNGKFPNLGNGLSVYDTAALTEDNELTLCAKRLNYRVLSPKECTVETAMMPTFKSLYKQRRRWQRGALENIYAHGIDRHTAPYLLRQMLTYSGVIFVALYLMSLGRAIWIGEELPWTAPLWLGVFVLYIFEQTFSVRKGGWRCIALTLCIIPEIFYNLFLNLVYVVSLEALIFGWSEVWGRMRDPNKSAVTESIKSSNRGKRDIRLTPQGRIIEFAIELIKNAIGIFILSMPFWNPQLAWNLIAIYVLIGATATIMRLVPVKTL
jgi:cellulose synthase/poly-beta-1,6-N-acetylglucosamine synthase-like glycosyltransferase